TNSALELHYSRLKEETSVVPDTSELITSILPRNDILNQDNQKEGALEKEISPELLNFKKMKSNISAKLRFPPPSAFKSITTENYITSFAIYKRESIIAFAESNSTILKIVKWPSGNQIGVLEAHADLSIISMDFSFDGQYFATLGDLPSYQVSIWDWRNLTLICKSSNEFPASQISFNPRNSRQFCTSGLDGGIKFWQMHLGLKKNVLTFVQGSLIPSLGLTKSTEQINMISLLSGTDRINSATQALDALRILPTSHTWRVDQQVLCTSIDGNMIVQFNPPTGECSIALTSQKKIDYVQSKTPGIPSSRNIATANIVACLLGVDSTVNSEEIENSIGGNGNYKSDFGGAENIKQFLLGKDFVAIGGNDGKLRIIRADIDTVPHVTTIIPITENVPISALSISPDYREILILTEDKRLFAYRISSNELFLVLENDTKSIVAAEVSRLTGLLVTATSTGGIRFWDGEMGSVINSITIDATITSLAMSPISSIMAIGSQNGVVRIYDTSTILEDQPRLLMRERLHNSPISKLAFDSSGEFLVTISCDGKICFCDVSRRFRFLGYLNTTGQILTVNWSAEDPSEDSAEHLSLYALILDGEQNIGQIQRFQVPVNKDFHSITTETGEIPRSNIPVVIYQFQETIFDFAVIPKHLSAGRESFYVCSVDHKLKLYVVPSSPKTIVSEDRHQEILAMGPPQSEFLEHEKSSNHVKLSNLRDWVVTWSTDGFITFRTLLEPEKSVKILAHSPNDGGVRDVCLSLDSKGVYSVGESILRIWDWHYTTAGKRAAADASNTAEQIISTQNDLINEVVGRIKSFPIVADIVDSENEIIVSDRSLTKNREKTEAEKEKDIYRQQMITKLRSIKDRLLKLLQKNETLPDIEKIDREEFIIDFEERDRLFAKADALIRQVRKEIEDDNVKKRVIRNRIKKECWDSMEVIGQSVKSFRPDQLTGKIIDVTNYPIRKRISTEVITVNKIKFARKTQLTVSQMTKIKQKKSIKDNEDEE
ncbi:Cilia- and flagella-associated protein 43, partial [Nowakowskiella sp. JEL0078]